MKQTLEIPFQEITRYDKDLKKVSTSLVQILDEKPIWKGFYGDVSEVLVDYKGKKLRFAKNRLKLHKTHVYHI